MNQGPARRIVGFHRDDDGWWVAELECGHGRHMRHDPPWHVRPWVVTPAGRADMLGREVSCGKCPAEGASAVHRAPPGGGRPARHGEPGATGRG